MHLSRLTIRNFRLFGDGEDALDLALESGVTALVGRNDCGKSAIIDAVRYALLTRDQSYIRIQPEDFHIDADGKQSAEISIRCQLSGLSDEDKGAFAEYLSYEDDGSVTMFINWTARKLSDAPMARRWVDVSVRSGIDATGPSLEPAVRDLLSSTYLRPLRDAAREMSPGRGSRLSQILASVPDISEGAAFDESSPPHNPATVAQLSLLGLADYMSYHVKTHAGVSKAETAINSQYLSSLVLRGEGLAGKIDVTEGGSDNVRLRQILERLQLGLFEKDTAEARGATVSDPTIFSIWRVSCFSWGANRMDCRCF